MHVAPDASSPLDPLSAAEIAAAASLVKEEINFKGLNGRVLFNDISLKVSCALSPRVACYTHP